MWFWCHDVFWCQVAQCTQTGVRTTTTYRQDFPYIGLPLETAVTTAGMDGKLLRSAVNTWRLQGYRGELGYAGRGRLDRQRPAGAVAALS